MKTITLLTIAFLSIGMIANAQTIDKKLAKKIKEAEKEAALDRDEGITGPLHQNNIGKIVFSNNEVTRAIMNTGDFKQKAAFNLGETVYGRAFFSKGINQFPIISKDENNVEPNKNSRVFFLVYADGALIKKNASEAYDNNDGKYITTCQVPVIKNKEDGGISPEFTKALNALSPGKHTMKVELWGGNELREYKTLEPVAVGEFELNVGTGSKAKMGVSFDDVEAGMTDKATVDNMLLQMQKIAAAGKWKEKVVKVKLKYKDWFIDRNKVTGIIVGRIQMVYVYAEWPDGHCSYQDFEMEQGYDGSKYSGDFYQKSRGGERTCDCLNK